jgi:hypothetical protein
MMLVLPAPEGSVKPSSSLPARSSAKFWVSARATALRQSSR